MLVIQDWEEDCPRRGPGLTHAHWRDCNPEGVHPGTDERHEWRQCCHCLGFVGEEKRDPLSKHVREFGMREAGIPPEGQIDENAPLTLPQPAACMNGGNHRTFLKTPKIGDDGKEWDKCDACGQNVEPKLATGVLTGPFYGPGRGWVTPRMKHRWEAIAFRFRGLPG